MKNKFRSPDHSFDLMKNKNFDLQKNAIFYIDFDLMKNKFRSPDHSFDLMKNKNFDLQKNETFNIQKFDLTSIPHFRGSHLFLIVTTF